MKSKTIIISSPNNSGRGILTLYEENDLLKCKLRLYGVEKLNKYAKIGIYHNNEVYTANLLERDGVYTSSLVGDFDMDADFYSAIIKTDNNNEVLLSGGTYAGFYFNDEVFAPETTPELDTETAPETEQTNAEIAPETANAPAAAEDKCANCKYKEYFYSERAATCSAAQPEPDPTLRTTLTETSALTQAAGQPTEQPQPPTTEIPTILEQIVPQFNYIFQNYPPNSELNALIENAKFVSMNEGEYSLGALYDDEKIKYICYAVKSKYNTAPPEELGKHHQWLPLDKDDPLSDGYYLVFQDASDLKIIEV